MAISSRRKILFILPLIFVAFHGISQEKFSAESSSIQDILLQFADQYNINILFNPDYFNDDKIDLDLNEKSPKALLDKILATENVDIHWSGSNVRLNKYKEISGFIRDEDSGLALAYANIYDPNTKQGYSTNEYGFFKVKTDYLFNTFIASYVGYNSDTLDIKDTEGFIDIRLKTNSFFEEVVVSDNRFNNSLDVLNIDKGASLSKKDIEHSFGVGGLADLYQAALKDPGVISGPDGIGGLNIRGGSNDQNLVIYDGVTVYNAGHALGLYSIFNPHTISHSSLQKEYSSANYGGRLSGVLDLRVKEGNVEKIAGHVDISSVASQLSLDGPLSKKTQFFVSTRRSHVDPFFKNHTQAQKKEDFLFGESNFYFYDLHAKLSHSLSQRDRIFMSYYRGKDVFTDQNLFSQIYDNGSYDLESGLDVSWGNELMAFRWNRVFSDNMYGKFHLSQSRFNYGSAYYYYTFDYYSDIDEFEEELYFTDYLNEISDRKVSYDLDIFLNNNQSLFLGASYSSQKFKPGSISISSDVWDGSSDFEVLQETVNESYEVFEESLNNMSLYATYKWQSEYVVASTGLRYDRFLALDTALVQSHVFNELQPRAIISIAPNRSLSFFGSYNRHVQAVHVLSTAAVGLPNELWVPSIQFIDPSYSDQYSLGLRFDPWAKWRVEAAVFRKEMNNLVQYGNAASLPTLFEINTDCWCEDVVIGQGRSRGLELSLNYKNKNTLLAASYTLLKSERRFSELNNGEWYDHRFDQRHNLQIDFTYQLTERWSFYTNFQFGSGLAQTLYASPFAIQISDNISPVNEDQRSALNAHRLNAYHKLNLMARYGFEAWGAKHKISFGIHNLYNRQNPYFTYLIENPDFPEDDGERSRNGIPLIPNFNWFISF